MAGDHQLIVERLLQVVPDAQARGLLVREQNVAFGALAVIDHHVDHVAGLHGDVAAGVRELLDGNQAFGLVSEIDDDFLGGDFEDAALQHLALGGRSEVASSRRGDARNPRSPAGPGISGSGLLCSMAITVPPRLSRSAGCR